MALTRRRTSTPARIAASRANGAKSRGPITPVGKANTRANALRHGLRCETLQPAANSPEFQHCYQTTFERHLAELDPADQRHILAAHAFALAAAWHDHLTRLEDESLYQEASRLDAEYPDLTAEQLDGLAFKALSDNGLMGLIQCHATRWDRLWFRAHERLARMANKAQNEKQKSYEQTLNLTENKPPAHSVPGEPGTHSAGHSIGIQSLGAVSGRNHGL